MSKIHVLEGSTVGYQAIIHFAVPAGNNAVGNTWKSCIAASGGTKSTAMSIGNGVGQITQAEADQIAAGDVLEVSTTIGRKANGSAPTSQDITTLVDAVITQTQLDYAARLQYYGYTQN
jgi:hypothetical protein